MIIRFRVQNFRSFRNSTLIELAASGSKSHPGHLAVSPRGNLLKTYAVYGPNASGKSQLIQAVFFYCAIVRRQLPPFPSSLARNLLLYSSPHPEYIPDDLAGDPAFPVFMEMEFFHKGHVFSYGFSLQDALPLSELLLIDGKLMFQKEGESLRLGKTLRPKSGKYPDLVSGSFFLGTFVSQCPSVHVEDLKAFSHFFRQSCLFFDNSCLFSAAFSPCHIPDQIQSMLKQPQINRFLRKHITAMGISLPEDPSNFLASTGLTKLMFILYRYFCLSQTGGVILADDFTTFLHHNACLYLLRLFQSSENPWIQLIFTTHDISFLSRDHFRRDETAVISMDSAGNSRLHTLADLRVRSDANFSREYLEGKYGRIPVWDENGQETEGQVN